MHGLTIGLNEMPKFLFYFIRSQTTILGIGSYSKGNCAVKLKTDCQDFQKGFQIKVARHQMFSFDGIKDKRGDENRYCEEKSRISSLIHSSMSCDL